MVYTRCNNKQITFSGQKVIGRIRANFLISQVLRKISIWVHNAGTKLGGD